MKNKVTVIELASSFIRLLTGYVSNDSIYILHALEGEPFSTEGGLPVIREAADSLNLLLKTAKEQMNTEDLGPYLVLLPPDGFKSFETASSTATADKQSNFSINDYNNCVNRALKEQTNSDMEAVYCAPFLFHTDFERNLTEYPSGCRTDHFEINADVHCIDLNPYQHYMKILSKVNITPYLQMVSPYAGNYFIRGYKPSTMTYLTMDLEPEYCYLSYVSGNRLLKSCVLSENLNNCLDRAAAQLNVTRERAKELLFTFGFLTKTGFPFETDEGLSLEETGKTFMQCFRPLAQELVNQIVSISASQDAPIFLYGSGATIEELNRLFSKLLDRNCSSFVPHVLGVPGGSFDNCLGAVKLASLPYQKADDFLKKERKDFQVSDYAFDR